MKLDLFNHFFPEEYYRSITERPLNDPGLMERITHIRTLYDLELRMEQIESFGPDYAQILSLPGPAVETCTPRESAIPLSRMANTGLAELVQRYNRFFPAFIATVPMSFPEHAVKEAEYAIHELGACGIQVFTNVLGKPLDQPEFEPVWAFMERLDLPIFLHPARLQSFADYESEDASRFGLWMALGWPYEISAAMTRLVFSGVLERHPKLKIVVHHAGAMIPMFWQRINSTAQQKGGLQKEPAAYMKMFYADTALFGNLSGVQCGLDFFGADHMVFASDAPFGPASGAAFISSAISVVEQLQLTPLQREQVYSGTAQKLLHI